jgi:hypothetical protein
LSHFASARCWCPWRFPPKTMHTNGFRPQVFEKSLAGHMGFTHGISWDSPAINLPLGDGGNTKETDGDYWWGQISFLVTTCLQIGVMQNNGLGHCDISAL